MHKCRCSSYQVLSREWGGGVDYGTLKLNLHVFCWLFHFSQKFCCFHQNNQINFRQSLLISNLIILLNLSIQNLALLKLEFLKVIDSSKRKQFYLHCDVITNFNPKWKAWSSFRKISWLINFVSLRYFQTFPKSWRYWHLTFSICS